MSKQLISRTLFLFFKYVSDLGTFKKFSLSIETVRQIQENCIFDCVLNIQIWEKETEKLQSGTQSDSDGL